MARGRTSGRTETRTEEDLLETEGDLSQQDDETDAGFTSLEDHLFGHRPFQHQGDLYEGEQTTMLHPASEQETLMQHDLHAPPPTQVVMELPPGARVAPGLVTGGLVAAPGQPVRPAPQLIAAGGVFAGMSFVMAGSLVALGLAASVLIALMLYPPRLWAPGTVAVPGSGGTASTEAQPASAVPSELVEGVRFPAMFGFNDWRAQDLDEVLLEELLAQLGACRAIKLTGHTDPRGPDEVNDRVALARAAEVRRILVERGIDRRLIEVGSAGSAVPEIEDMSREARALNRRVTVRCD